MKEASENEFFEWFWCNADFGPSHDQVMLFMFAEFESDTGKTIPESITEGYLG
jgi:hypothetical protein